MSARDLAARFGCGKATAARALTELENAGFIRCMKIGTFKRKDRHASEYRINIFRCDVTGDTLDRAWNTAKWELPNGLSRETIRSPMEDGMGPKPVPQSHQLDCERQNRPSNGLTGETHLDRAEEDERHQEKARLHAGIGVKGRFGSARTINLSHRGNNPGDFKSAEVVQFVSRLRETLISLIWAVFINPTCGPGADVRFRGKADIKRYRDERPQLTHRGLQTLQYVNSRNSM